MADVKAPVVGGASGRDVTLEAEIFGDREALEIVRLLGAGELAVQRLRVRMRRASRGTCSSRTLSPSARRGY